MNEKEETSEFKKQEFLKELRTEAIKELKEQIPQQIEQMKKLVSMYFLEKKIDYSSSEIDKIAMEHLVFSLKESIKIIEKKNEKH